MDGFEMNVGTSFLIWMRKAVNMLLFYLFHGIGLLWLDWYEVGLK